jgi:hypothetical protein
MIEIIFGLLTIILAIIAIYQTHRAHQLELSVVKAEGIFEKPEILLSLYGNSQIEEVIWALPIPKDAVVEVPLKYQIRNVGGGDQLKSLKFSPKSQKNCITMAQEL